MRIRLLIPFLLLPALALADTYSPKVHMNGPDEMEVESGGAIEVKTGGTLTVAGVTIDADTLAMTDLDATAAELNVLADVTPGTVTAGKAVVTTTGKVVDELDITLLKIGTVNKTAALADAVESPVASTSDGKKIIGGSYTVVADDDTANTKTIATGITITTAQVQILRAGAVATGDAAVSFAAGNLVVADGSTYVLTAGDVLNWIAFGS